MNIGISGHQQIPAEGQGFVRDAIGKVVAPVENLVGVSSLAAGADQIFSSEVTKARGRLIVIIPCGQYESTFSNPNDLAEFLRLLKHAESVETLDYEEGSEEAFFAAGCRVVDKSELLVAVWDGKPARGKGGTADIVKYARNRGLRVHPIWPEGLSR